MEAAFARMGWTMRRVEGREVLEGDFDLYHTRVRVHAQAFAELNAVNITANLGHEVPASRAGLVAEALMRSNRDLTIGAFELDYDSGRICFRAANIFPDDRIEPGIIGGMVHTALAEADRLTPFLTLLLLMSTDELSRLNLKLFLMREDLLPPVPEDTGLPS